jgi:hypothetical protein
MSDQLAAELRRTIVDRDVAFCWKCDTRGTRAQHRMRVKTDQFLSWKALLETTIGSPRDFTRLLRPRARDLEASRRQRLAAPSERDPSAGLPAGLADGTLTAQGFRVRRAGLLFALLLAGVAGLVCARTILPAAASAYLPPTVTTVVSSLPATTRLGTSPLPPTTATTVVDTLPPTTTVETSPPPPTTTFEPPPVPPMPPILVFGRRTRRSGCRLRGALPDRRCTPGEAFGRVTAPRMCRPGYAGSVANVSGKLERAVYLEYGITRLAGRYEIDHLVSLELGGDNSIANLWPEAATPRPGFHEKDRLETYLRHKVCSGAADLRVAQRMLATDWLAAYRRMRP